MANLVSSAAPDFQAKAVLEDNAIDENFKLSNNKGKYIVLFFYPLDFTFVCPTEILAFNEKLSEFQKRGAELIGVSVDSVYTHIAWKKTPVEKGGVGQIGFTLVSDLNKRISKQYEVLFDDEAALRGLFLIDKEFVVRHCVVNDQPFGRSVGEALRMLDALIHFDKYGKLCPADWKEGEPDMEASSQGVVDYLSDGRFSKK